LNIFHQNTQLFVTTCVRDPGTFPSNPLHPLTASLFASGIQYRGILVAARQATTWTTRSQYMDYTDGPTVLPTHATRVMTRSAFPFRGIKTRLYRRVCRSSPLSTNFVTRIQNVFNSRIKFPCIESLAGETLRTPMEFS